LNSVENSWSLYVIQADICVTEQVENMGRFFPSTSFASLIQWLSPAQAEENKTDQEYPFGKLRASSEQRRMEQILYSVDDLRSGKNSKGCVSY